MGEEAGTAHTLPVPADPRREGFIPLHSSFQGPGVLSQVMVACKAWALLRWLSDISSRGPPVGRVSVLHFKGQQVALVRFRVVGLGIGLTLAVTLRGHTSGLGLSIICSSIEWG